MSSTQKKLLVWYEENRGGETLATEMVVRHWQKKDVAVVIKRKPLLKGDFLSLGLWIIYELASGVVILWKYRHVRVLYTTTYVAAFMATIFSRIRGFPKIIWHYHGTRLPEKTDLSSVSFRGLIKLIKYSLVYWLHFIALTHCQVVIAPSRPTKELLIESFSLHSRKVKLLLNGIDNTKFSPISHDEGNAIRKKNHISPRRYVIAYVGRLDTHKGVERLVKVFKEVKKELPYSTLLIAYPSPQAESERHTEKTIRLLTKSLSLDEVFFLRDYKVREVYSMADLIVSFSTLEYASPTLVLLETMSCHRFFLTTTPTQKHFLNSLDPRFYVPEQVTDTLLASKLKELLLLAKVDNGAMWKKIDTTLREFSKEKWIEKINKYASA